MILKDLANKMYKRICYSLETKRVLFVGVSPRSAKLIRALDKRCDLTTVDKDLLRAKFGSGKHYVLDVTKPMPFPKEHFDAIVMLGVIGYGLNDIKSILKTFENIKPILKEKGKVYFELTKERKLK